VENARPARKKPEAHSGAHRTEREKGDNRCVGEPMGELEETGDRGRGREVFSGKIAAQGVAG